MQIVFSLARSVVHTLKRGLHARNKNFATGEHYEEVDGFKMCGNVKQI